MVIVAGSLEVEPAGRRVYLDGCLPVVEAARRAPGCLDFAVSADSLDPGRVNVFERWESQAAVEAFRGVGVGDDQAQAIIAASVAEYDVAALRVLAGEPDLI
ncbi:antibiotic biosynthesis monooxygenase [Gordonia jinghuaiqii]|uniref:Antibiotic biosynthesis monooxygenase n=1 Tax=Gordonia jinghuaiqii TaxID=2758710 RepID=A0A7D7LZT2_9ACTN|nr:antibiotic biosynthesis monooxygenase [Gordonia jinghuaiqii]MCR5976727.1 antibiotic biosynthesis monooxygenase [Gordonia jinghuaiqii]QMT03899.1 antibiotic biosynthesis monooxygenase [Gordonia jinghuaiqii]